MDKTVHQICYGSMGGEGYHMIASDSVLGQSEEMKKMALKLFQSPSDLAKECFFYLTIPLRGKETAEKACFIYTGSHGDRGRVEKYGQMYLAPGDESGYGEEFLKLLRVEFDSKDEILQQRTKLKEKEPGLLEFQNVYDSSLQEDMKQLLVALYAHKTVAYVMEYSGKEFPLKARYVIWEVYRRLPFRLRKEIGCAEGVTPDMMQREDFPAPYKLILMPRDTDLEELDKWKEEDDWNRGIVRAGEVSSERELDENTENWINGMFGEEIVQKEDFMGEHFSVCNECLEKGLPDERLPDMKEYLVFLNSIQRWQMDEAVDGNLDLWLCEYERNGSSSAPLNIAMRKVLQERNIIKPDVIAEWLLHKQAQKYFLDESSRADVPVWMRSFRFYTDIMGERDAYQCAEIFTERALEEFSLSDALKLPDLVRRINRTRRSRMALKSLDKGKCIGWWEDIFIKFDVKIQSILEESEKVFDQKLKKAVEEVTDCLDQIGVMQLREALKYSSAKKEELISVFSAVLPNEWVVNKINELERDKRKECIEKCLENFDPASEEELNASLDEYHYIRAEYGNQLSAAVAEKWDSYEQLAMIGNSPEIRFKEDAVSFCLDHSGHISRQQLYNVLPWSRWEALHSRGLKEEEACRLISEKEGMHDLIESKNFRKLVKMCRYRVDYSENEKTDDFEKAIGRAGSLKAAWNMEVIVLFPGSLIEHDFEEAISIRRNISRLENQKDGWEIYQSFENLAFLDVQYFDFLWEMDEFQIQRHILQKAIFGQTEQI